MNTDTPSPPSYWYSDSADDERGARIMEAMRAYRSAEMAMRRRTQESMAMGENELLVLRYLARSASAGSAVTPIDLARHLGVSTASMTALLDRLEKSGHLQRHPHPSDRRKVLVTSTTHADEEIRDTLTAMHARMMRATRGMSESETAAVTQFLTRMRCAVADLCAVSGTCCPEAAATRASPLEPDAAA
ncbi:DNA-binding transcriptional regulator, MarR family [Microbacterium hydrothermale]|uniref:MarR family winged helix-turn-helix transcriptional regulator n=1 Tax=Microbacterium hydrothermale TaxID=857427 RepID=UPI002226ABDE|nr:MarR family transcriptional regulator [Microbacterium hydrothermale]MCW2163559.1 DNA-binding transcriptional regulator, MarR family [Microbacterium hydrothermale]